MIPDCWMWLDDAWLRGWSTMRIGIASDVHEEAERLSFKTRPERVIFVGHDHSPRCSPTNQERPRMAEAKE